MRHFAYSFIFPELFNVHIDPSISYSKTMLQEMVSTLESCYPVLLILAWIFFFLQAPFSLIVMGYLRRKPLGTVMDQANFMMTLSLGNLSLFLSLAPTFTFIKSDHVSWVTVTFLNWFGFTVVTLTELEMLVNGIIQACIIRRPFLLGSQTFEWTARLVNIEFGTIY